MKAHAACLPRLSIVPRTQSRVKSWTSRASRWPYSTPGTSPLSIARLELSVPAGLRLQDGRLPQDRKHTFAENRGLPR